MQSAMLTSITDRIGISVTLHLQLYVSCLWFCDLVPSHKIKKFCRSHVPMQLVFSHRQNAFLILHSMLLSFSSSENHWCFQTKVRGTLRSPEPQMDQIFSQGTMCHMFYQCVNNLKECQQTCHKKTSFLKVSRLPSSLAVLSVLFRPRLLVA